MPKPAESQAQTLSAHKKPTATLAQSHWPLSRWLVIAAVLIVLDQLSKWYFELNFQFAERLNILPFFDFILVYNTGAAFSFLANHGGWQRWFFAALSLIASAVIIYLLRRNPAKSLFNLALTLILAGALGNLVDRLLLGHVIDFLLFYWGDRYFPAFNLADCFITVGAGLLILDELLRIRRQKQV
ncbi:signal peptidase II [Oligella urethralis]|uniref:signal peptidase II n=1 Tax=Oligella urethralis TaxID=90245 RepID=UPI0027BB11FC|nr:signal peptidase II [Oligella urethralis]